MEVAEQSKVWKASIDQSGRVLIPADLRQSIAIKPGQDLLWVKDSSGLHLKSFEDSLAEIQAYYQSLSPTNVVWSEELLAQRRAEALHD